MYPEESHSLSDLIVTKGGVEVHLHILTTCQDGRDLLVWTILLSKESSNHILSWDMFASHFEQPPTLTIRQSENRLTFLGPA